MKRTNEKLLVTELERSVPGDKFLLTLDKDFSIRYVCNGFRGNFGLSIGQFLHELPAPFSGPRWKNKIKFLFDSGHDLYFTEKIETYGLLRKFRVDLTFAGDILICTLTSISDKKNAVHLKKIKTPGAVTEIFPDIYCVAEKNKEGVLCVTEISSSAEKVSGYTIDEIQSKPVISLLDPVQYSILQNKINSRNVKGLPIELLSKTGKKIPVNFSSTKGNNKYYFVISDRNNVNSLENLLYEKENFYKSLLENSMEITSVISKTGHFEYITPAVKHLMGYEPSDLVGNYVFDFIHPDDHELALKAFTNRVLEGGTGKRLDWRFRNKFGQYRHLAVMINSSHDSVLEGGVVINAVDVTERYNAERSLIRSNYRFKMINDINNITLHSSSVNSFAETSINLIVKKIINCDRGSIYIIRDDKAEFVATSVAYGNSAIEKGSVVSLNEMDCTGFISNGSYYLVHDVREKENPSASDLMLIAEGIVSYLVFPLTANNKLIGAIILGSVQKGFFTHEIIDFISGIATEIAVGIEEAYLKERLVQSESQKSAIVAGIPDLIFRLDKKGVFLDGFFNESELIKILPEKIIGEKITNVLPGSLGADYLMCAGRALVNSKMQLLEHEIENKGETFYYEARFSPTDHNEVIILVRDITQSVTAKTELELRNSAIESSPEGIFIAKADTGKILFFNKSLLNITGLDEKEMDKMHFCKHDSEMNILKVLCSSETPPGIFAKIKKNEIIKVQNNSSRKDGTSYWNTFTIHALKKNDRITHFVGSLLDITQMKNLEQKMMNEAIEAQENDRKRIAADLHDGLAQTLSAVNMYFQALQEMESNKPNANVTSRITGELLNRAIAESRLISYNLMPSSLVKFGLGQTITELISRHAFLKIGLIIKFSNRVSDKRFGNATEITIFRIVQEIISNSIKHSEASLLELCLEEENNCLILSAMDNGKGFEIKKAAHQGAGLQNLKARVEAMNGTLNITAAKDEGTRIILKIPGINSHLITTK